MWPLAGLSTHDNRTVKHRSLESCTGFIHQNAAPPAITPAAHDRDTGFSPKETGHIEL
ncbi:hypothetical protein H4R18_000809 [Coemansia javaensis]|uniref:Uncharacterized protein n=1 Tax=Coemansia javaensis TaxID=2761396 RepID=A0A9W8LL73_9FUNG|nr:hypothetical protein H4R18_000809 [Coemansia javaensis]